MSPDEAVERLAGLAGIAPSFRDLSGQVQATSHETRLALLQACGWQLDNSAMIVDALKYSKAAERARILPDEVIVTSRRKKLIKTPRSGTWELVLEGAENVAAGGVAGEAIALPAMPCGVHKLMFKSGDKNETIRLIVAPSTAPSVANVAGAERIWGVNCALYGLHSQRNPGLGDYDDLRNVCTSLAGYGADFCGINPVHAIGWNHPEIISPYSPSHRGFLSSTHIALDQIEPVSEETRLAIVEWRQRSAQHASEQVDYAFHAQHHRPLLLALHKDFLALASHQQRSAFDTFCKSDESLRSFAQFEHLSAPKTTPEFHLWLQWQAGQQLIAAQQNAKASGMNLGLYLDLAVGARRDGAEAWVERDSVAEGVSIGAPPDHLSPAGQNWNLTAYAPQKLAAVDYRAFRSVLSRNMQQCGILRIDHVLGLNRSFWIPDNGAPGGYIRHNFDALLALVRIEAARNGTVIIGEDLGLVPAGFRQALQRSGIYSYSVLQYEKTGAGSFRKASGLRKKSLACFGTHDTPTLAGYAAGRDIDWWRKLGWIDAKSETTARKQRQQECAQLKALYSTAGQNNMAITNPTLSPLSKAVHSALAASPVAMMSVQLDDVEGNIEAQNLPGTIDEHPNWQRRSTIPVDALSEHGELGQIGNIMSEAGRGPSVPLPKEPQSPRQP